MIQLISYLQRVVKKKYGLDSYMSNGQLLATESLNIAISPSKHKNFTSYLCIPKVGDYVETDYRKIRAEILEIVEDHKLENAEAKSSENYTDNVYPIERHNGFTPKNFKEDFTLGKTALMNSPLLLINRCQKLLKSVANEVHNSLENNFFLDINEIDKNFLNKLDNYTQLEKTTFYISNFSQLSQLQIRSLNIIFNLPQKSNLIICGSQSSLTHCLSKNSPLDEIFEYLSGYVLINNEDEMDRDGIKDMGDMINLNHHFLPSLINSLGLKSLKIVNSSSNLIH